jgi:hypothetical protein
VLVTKEDEMDCEVCGRPGEPAYVSVNLGGGSVEWDTPSGTPLIIGDDLVGRSAVLCGRPECQGKAEDQLRALHADPEKRLKMALELEDR